MAGVFQPVEITAPEGAWIALAEAGTWTPPQKAPVHVGLLVGHVYRICVLNIPGQIGQEVFPTIEIIDRLYAPAGQETRFPIPIELTAEDLRLALEGKYVTRVIYLEDPERALPAPVQAAGQSWFEVPPGRDPLVVADALGRPVAILRLGGRVPEQADMLDPQFLFGCPPLWRYEPPQPAEPQPPRVTVLPRPPRSGRATPVAMEVSSR